MAVNQYSLNHKVRWVTWNETLSSALYSETKTACEMVIEDKQECTMMPCLVSLPTCHCLQYGSGSN